MASASMATLFVPRITDFVIIVNTSSKNESNCDHGSNGNHECEKVNPELCGVHIKQCRFADEGSRFVPWCSSWVVGLNHAHY